MLSHSGKKKISQKVVLNGQTRDKKNIKTLTFAEREQAFRNKTNLPSRKEWNSNFIRHFGKIKMES